MKRASYFFCRCGNVRTQSSDWREGSNTLTNFLQLAAERGAKEIRLSLTECPACSSKGKREVEHHDTRPLWL